VRYFEEVVGTALGLGLGLLLARLVHQHMGRRRRAPAVGACPQCTRLGYQVAGMCQECHFSATHPGLPPPLAINLDTGEHSTLFCELLPPAKA
jgi:hypothetical protein